MAINKERLEVSEKLAIRYIEDYVNEKIRGLPIPLVFARLSNIILHNRLRLEYVNLTLTDIINRISNNEISIEDLKEELKDLKSFITIEPSFIEDNEEA